jgi:hypothetical protein
MLLRDSGIYLQTPHGVTTQNSNIDYLHRRENLKSLGKCPLRILRKKDEVNETGSESCQAESFAITNVKPSGSATGVVIRRAHTRNTVNHSF